MKAMRLFFVLVLVLALAAGCAPSVPEQSNNAPGQASADSSKPTSEQKQPVIGLNIGNLAPDFTLTLDDGKSIKLSDLRGKPVFLNFWATWCPWCKLEMPDIQKIYDEKHNVEIIAIDVKESPMKVRSFIEPREFTFPIGYDSTGDIATLYMATGLPTSYAIDAKGIIRYQIQGATNYAQLRQWFAGLEESTK